MILICIGDSGDVHSFKNVLAYDCLTNEDLENVCEALNVEPTFTAEEMQNIKLRLGKIDDFPNLEDLRWIVKDVIAQRK